MDIMKIPKCVSTQHPDNVNSPFFAENTELGGEDEIQEAYYAFSHLDCDEQLRDCEGKEVDNFVVKKLLTKYESFFREKILGRDVFITLRVPNPTAEKAEVKILLETLESMPRSFNAAKLFYQDDTPPIFEVILPMTASPKCLDRICRYYCDFVTGKQNNLFKEGDVTIAEWIGEFEPGRINVRPLFEDMEHMLDAHNITKEYLQDKEVEYQRVFLARSDPAMNYGLISAILLNKIALQRLQRLSEEIGIEIYPIPKSSVVPDIVTAGLPTIAVRMPSYPVALELIKEGGTPVAGPSANLFSHLSPTTAAHVKEQLGSAIGLLLDGGRCSVGVESTVISLVEKRALLLRPGGLPLEDIEKVMGKVRIPESNPKKPQSPGQLPRHYSPNTPLRLKIPKTVLENGERIGLLEKAGLDVIYAEPVPETGLGRAIMDRLHRASSGNHSS